jgi:methylmalonyl-CoA mutase
MATRGSEGSLPERLGDVIAVLRAGGFDLVIVETPGIGQGDAGIVPFVDRSLYVMTPEFGAASQLEKIDMLDFADVVAINKFERRGAEDARRDVGRQLVRNREAFGASWEDMPVFGTSAATFNDDGVTALYQHLVALLGENGLVTGEGRLPRTDRKTSSEHAAIIPPARTRYLSDVAATVRAYHEDTAVAVDAARQRQHLRTARAALRAACADEGGLAGVLEHAEKALPADAAQLLDTWPEVVEAYSGDEMVVQVRDRELRTQLSRQTLSGNKVRRVALPRYTEDAELLRFLRRENLPGKFPFTAGVFAFKREGEDPARMFAGEGDAFRTNRRFTLLSADSDAKRLSTAFDSVTLYGREPDTRPDIYGKVGTSGVSIATLEDMKVLYGGFDLTSPTTSVSMTINGPAPTILAFYLNTAIDQQVEKFRAEHGREPSAQEHADLTAFALANVRGTVQADILKEDQGQNTCIFSTEFSLRMMADIQEWFIQHKVRNFYSVSISGYHIAEAGANPISQLAFTLANGFTFVESYLARGMDIDEFAPNLSFFFSNGMDAEYSVIGRVARRIWAVAMRERYGANERSQKLKYHVQTSGRSLHAQEMDFNDIRTTLQALCALYDNANSLHTNAFDEAVTTPTESSVRRAMAIQLIINREWGLSMNENPLQGSFVIDELTDLVEDAVLAEFDRIAERGGVLGAMETGYQRGKIQDESMLYEHRKHDGTLPIVGVNTFVREGSAGPVEIELARATEAEKKSQLDRLADFRARHAGEAQAAIRRLQDVATGGGNVFDELMTAARVCSLGQLTDAFFEVGGQYRRNM